VNDNGFLEYVRESQNELIIFDNLTDYDVAYKAFRNVFWARF